MCVKGLYVSWSFLVATRYALAQIGYGTREPAQLAGWNCEKKAAIYRTFNSCVILLLVTRTRSRPVVLNCGATPAHQPTTKMLGAFSARSSSRCVNETLLAAGFMPQHI